MRETKAVGSAPGHNCPDAGLRMERYAPEYREAWDGCVDSALNGHLLFFRNFMEYHADRFQDHSLIIRQKEKIVAVFPANERNGTLYSHQGLTFGGLVHGEKFYAADVLAFYELLKVYMRDNGLSRLICKPVPFPYTRGACQAQDYALTRAGARIAERHLSAAVDLRDPLPMAELRARGVKKAMKGGISIRESEDFAGFLAILASVLERHGSSPKHTAAELALLRGRFPKSIKLTAAFQDDGMLAGVLVFFTKTAAHMQYICSSPEGQKSGALDLIMKTLMDEQRPLRRWFCYGISTEGNGEMLNAGLMRQKEGFGARGFVHDIYELTVKIT